jgi:phosphomethylpyrimidine synthase
MKITQEVREYAKGLELEAQKIDVSALDASTLNVDTLSVNEAESGMQKMSAQFRELGSDVYLTTDKLTIDTSTKETRATEKSKEKSL